MMTPVRDYEFDIEKLKQAYINSNFSEPKKQPNIEDVIEEMIPKHVIQADEKVFEKKSD